MGVSGLTTFISIHSDYYLTYYTLHDTYLVIDGCSVQAQLYLNTKCNCAFGGDYDKYARYVADFFDGLLKCNITPLVLFDGGCENKKLKTVLMRTSEKIYRASYYTSLINNRNNQLFPIFLNEVFKTVIIEKGIKYAKCTFEADNVIAAIARLLKCPVLSLDSDFYIYGSLYIPFDTLNRYVVRNSQGNGYMLQCKIYYVEKLFHRYKGLNQSLLPLVAIILGNDYVKQDTFKNFLRHLPLPPTGSKKFNERQWQINATFNWLRKYSLNQAVWGILSEVPIQERKKIVVLIEKIINSYINASLNTLIILDIPTESLSKDDIQDLSKPYKFQGDINQLTYIEEKSDDTDVDNEEETNQDVQEVTNLLQKMELISNESRINKLPRWFIKEFNQGIYPSYFIDLIIRRLYLSYAQVENYLFPSSLMVSLGILNVTYALLISDVDKNKSNMKYITRGEGCKMKRYFLQYSDNIYGYKLPSLSSLRNLPVTVRREILNITLRITDQSCLNDIPPPWALYIAVMNYWIKYLVKQENTPLDLNCHVYSLLFALLFDIIDTKTGFYRIKGYFQDKYYKTIQNIQSERKANNYRPQYSTAVTISEAIHEVNVDDCLLAAPYFISNFTMDEKLYTNLNKFNVTIVHGFAEFQYCLYHSIYLNALLRYPYEQTKVAKMFNGTLLYNLCNSFKKRNDVESYINQMLQDSPSLARLFNVLLTTVKPLFPVIMVKKVQKRKKPKTKSKKKKRVGQKEDSSEEEPAEDENRDICEIPFYDENNPFSILNVV